MTLPSFRALTTALLAFGLLTTCQPAQAQRRAQAADPATLDIHTARLQPLFGGLSAAEATTLLGADKLDAIAGSFASRAEASTFFVNKGYEYLVENQPDTAVYRFNLAWLLNPRNAEAYRGLGVAASTQPTPDASIGLLQKALALAPANGAVLNDLGSSYINRYNLTRKKKDLKTGTRLLERGLATDSTNAEAWQQLARAYYQQKKYAEAWDALHKGQNLRLTSLDFGLINNLLTQLPDPKGIFK